MRINPLHAIDFYKADHRRQYPAGTEMVYSNFTCRSDKLFNVPKNLGIYDNRVVIFGIQIFIKDFLITTWNENFFNKPKDEVVKAYKRRMDNALGKDAIPVEHIEALHDLGYLPLVIKALPEGTLCPINIPAFVIYNTVPQFFWLTNYIESVMSAYIWKPITAATIALCYKKLLTKYAKETGGNLGFVDFQAHDFSFRGMGTVQDGAISGAAHLTSFAGTDTVLALDLLEEYYNADCEKEFLGGSVPASEHSSSTASILTMPKDKLDELETEFNSRGIYQGNAKIELLLGEYVFFKRMLTELYPSGIVSLVSDSFDFWSVLTEIATRLKPEIMSRNGKLVFRPDSGDPVDIICGEVGEFIPEINCDIDYIEKYAKDYFVDKLRDETPHGECGDYSLVKKFKSNGKYYLIDIDVEWNRYDKQFYYIDGSRVNSLTEIDEPVRSVKEKGAIEILWEIFGGTTSLVDGKEYKHLDPHVGLIYGDSITLDRAAEILKRLKDKGFASDNVVLGVGSYSYQYLTRDTLGSAIKATYSIVNGEGNNIYKDPATDSGTKKSAKGLLSVQLKDGKLVLEQEQESIDMLGCQFVEVFRDGKLLVDDSISAIRERIKKNIE